ncbi:probable Adenosylmethionine-8-amino-7-oxononanoate aminotransferase [Saccharomycodes ludwigii]|uniref:Probable Adenosylmethionine-8-amino-7-oxononanoate aminotransferase n=1 Tax=Saccharomycodes ludwigii TaxID=36035 RepID=A0A376BA15_9ASCO|nr:hypothetical protein SCDLUD_003789 [Saccharomycodes ludwigii]KAH3900783.1 hypothetical protein SCDLUD_003789 [Saccharomycodes ludwigii]SSD61497.1 probable Adenosylmethionine-8-amino-7-oxononanoate aminotransferase [Saccharomycodes ludwigii]
MSVKYSKETQELIKFDQQHLWHPYTSMENPLPVYPVKCAKGSTITLDTVPETKLIEAMSSWWCMIFGYNNEELNEAMKNQIDNFSHVMFGGLTHRPAIKLGENILKMLNVPQLNKVFFADSGSVAVEVALKMALQYQFTLNGAKNKKCKFLTIKHGYSGDTMGAMSVCDPKNSMHSIYTGYLPENIFAKAPKVLETLPTSNIYYENSKSFDTNWDPTDILDFKEKIELFHGQIAAVIMEPILQGAGGMRIYHPQFLIEVRKLCTQYKIPLILDEIATGFGRTGELFAFNHANKYQKTQTTNTPFIDVYPDILCIGKSLTGGYMTLSAVICTDEISSVISNPSSPTGGCFMHGPTFMANPLACSVANKTMEILQRGEWKGMIKGIEKQLYEELYMPLKKELMDIIQHVRIIGAIGIVELKSPVDSLWFQKKNIEKGIYIRPFNRLCYLMPPFIITKEELSFVIQAVKETLNEWKVELDNRKT